jgi:NADPH:quinone reductase-like Zn-dependent oxidoreductase
MGYEAAGIIDELGEGVGELTVGERVFGFSAEEGAQAELAVLSHFAPIPPSLHFPLTHRTNRHAQGHRACRLNVRCAWITQGAAAAVPVPRSACTRSSTMTQTHRRRHANSDHRANEVRAPAWSDG